MSALFDAAAVVVVALLIQQLVSGSRPMIRGRRAIAAGLAGASGGLLLAFSTQFWIYATVAEVFALNNLFASLLLLLACTWYRDPQRRTSLWLLFLTAGLASANQQTIVFLAPGLAVWVLLGIRRLRGFASWLPDPPILRRIGIGTVFLVVGLLPYVYLPLAAAANPAVNWGNPTTFDAFIRLVTRADYGTGQLVAGGAHGSVSENLYLFGRYLVDSFGPIGCALAVAGLIWLWRYRRVSFFALVLCFLSAGPLFLAFANPPTPEGLMRGIVSRFYILPSIPFAVVVGTGAFGLTEWITEARFRRAWRPALATALLFAVIVLPVSSAFAHATAADQSDNQQTLNFTKDVLQPLEGNALLLSVGDTTILGPWYVQHAEGFRPDVSVIAVPLLSSPWYVDNLRRRESNVSIPFDRFDPASGADIGKLVDANIGRRPVYYVGVISDRFPPNYDELRVGFARRLVPKGQAPDPFAYIASHLDELKQLQFPTKAYGPETWEAWEATQYGAVAFNIANALERTDVTAAEQWYRRAIELNPSNPGTYQNLAILIAPQGRVPEVADLLKRFLTLAPNDPQAPQMREFLISHGYSPP
jgi:tetratricopeptide (TPR) repeat protein